MDSAQISYDVLNLLKVIAKYCCAILSSCHARQWYILAIFEWSLGNQKSGGRLRIKYQYQEPYCILADSPLIKETTLSNPYNQEEESHT